MPSELEELVGFIINPNPQIRLLAVENLVPYSGSQPALFKANNLEPVQHLKILLAGHPKIAEHALTILINLSGDPQVLKNIASDQVYLGLLYAKLADPKEPNANLLAMLLANLAKSDELLLKSVMESRQEAPAGLSSDDRVINQLMDLFVRGADGSYNSQADYDYLAYCFSDLAKHASVRQHLLQQQAYDGVVPLTKLNVFTEHRSDVRRKGVANTLKNVAFDVPSHPALLSEDQLNVLPYVLLPLAGGETYDDDEMNDMLPDLQLLPPDKQRDSDPSILQTHVETLILLTTTRAGRDYLRKVQVYPLIREMHLRVEDEDLRETCDRLVQVLMRDEADEAEEGEGEGGEGAKGDHGKPCVQELEEDEDEQLVEV